MGRRPQHRAGKSGRSPARHYAEGGRGRYPAARIAGHATLLHGSLQGGRWRRTRLVTSLSSPAVFRILLPSQVSATVTCARSLAPYSSSAWCGSHGGAGPAGDGLARRPVAADRPRGWRSYQPARSRPSVRGRVCIPPRAARVAIAVLVATLFGAGVLNALVGNFALDRGSVFIEWIVFLLVARGWRAGTVCRRVQVAKIQGLLRAGERFSDVYPLALCDTVCGGLWLARAQGSRSPTSRTWPPGRCRRSRWDARARRWRGVNRHCGRRRALCLAGPSG